MIVYRIAKWATVFERAESRKLKQLTWVAMPIGFTSNGYQLMLDDFGDDAPAAYGAWCALVSVAAGCELRGVLANSRGIPLKLSHIARITGMDCGIFERVIEWASSGDVGWLEAVPPEEIDVLLGKPEAPDDPGEAPDNPPAAPDNTPEPRGNAPSTQHNITGHNITLSAAARAAAADGFRGLDGAEVARLANRLQKSAPELPREFVWQACCIGEVLSPGMVAEMCTRLAGGEVRKPRGYIEAALRKEAAKGSIDWRDLLPFVPVPKLKECEV